MRRAAQPRTFGGDVDCVVVACIQCIGDGATGSQRQPDLGITGAGQGAPAFGGNHIDVVAHHDQLVADRA